MKTVIQLDTRCRRATGDGPAAEVSRRISVPPRRDFDCRLRSMDRFDCPTTLERETTRLHFLFRFVAGPRGATAKQLS